MDNQTQTSAPNHDPNRDDQTRKRLFVLCDGTWQDGVNNQRRLTNVATFARCLEGVSGDRYLQIVYYDSGVGNATSIPARLVDGVTGRGISAKIRNAYSFLSHNFNFEHNEDEIFLIGFSRGAFAVQCLASFISQTGLFQKQHLYYLRGLFALWKNQTFRRTGSGEHMPVARILQSHVRKFREERLLHRVKIKACVVWDTVSALGLPTPWPRSLSFVGKKIPEAIENAFQVLALDERRAQFKPCIWDSKEGEDTHVKQCWFLGSHTNVGGNGDAVLGAVALIWIIGQLQENTNVTFNEREVMKHLKNRLLEWDFHINDFMGMIREAAILSNMSNSARVTKPSWYWWLSGIKTRKNYLQPDLCRPDLQLIHFTVRFAMAEGINNSKLLRKWKTEIHDNGTIYWRLQDRYLVEDKLNNDIGCMGYKEYKMFERWSDQEFTLEPTDRGAFATRMQALIRIWTEKSCGHSSSFVSLLASNLVFKNHHLAPKLVYSPETPPTKSKSVGT